MTSTVRALALTAVAAALLTGCADRPQMESMDAPTARDRMVTFVERTTATADGDWTARSNGPASSGCTTPDGDPGVTFSWDQERSGADDPEALVRTVAAMWQEKDHDVTFRQDRIDDGRPLWTALTTGRAVESISVNASPRRVSIHVQSMCGTGDIDDFE